MATQAFDDIAKETGIDLVTSIRKRAQELIKDLELLPAPLDLELSASLEKIVGTLSFYTLERSGAEQKGEDLKRYANYMVDMASFLLRVNCLNNPKLSLASEILIGDIYQQVSLYNQIVCVLGQLQEYRPCTGTGNIRSRAG